MNTRLIIFIGIIILSFSCERNPKDRSNQKLDEQSQSVNKPHSINNGLNEKTIELIEEVEDEPPLINEEYLPNGIIEPDSTIWLMANMRKDYRIFGYKTPSTASRKLFLFSVFTDDVNGNPLNCRYGSFYETFGMDQMGITLKYVSDTLDFKKLAIIKDGSIKDFAYVENKWLEFHDEM